MRRRLPVAAALVAFSFALCGGTAGAANLYVPNYGTTPEAISGFASAPDGSLSPIAGSPFPVSAAASGINAFAFTPDGDRAVATFLFHGGVLGLARGAGGSLAAPVAPTVTPSVTGLAVTPDGRFAYAPTRDFMMVPPVGILGYSIGADGALSALSGSPFSSGEFGDVAISPDGRFLFAVGPNQVRRFAIGADGTLTDLGSPAPSGGVFALAVSPDGRFLFTGSGGGADDVRSFSIAADGGLTQNGDPVPTGGNSLGFIAVAPDSRHIYMPDGDADLIVTAAVAADGVLSVIDSKPVTDPGSVAVSPDGRFLYYGADTSVIGVASIGADGVPTLLPSTVPWSSGEPERILFAPAPAPRATFTAKQAPPGALSRFDASGSTGAVRFDWNFGDGTTLPDGGPTPTHRYAKAGRYGVSLIVTDAQGCSTRSIYTGQSTTCPGGALPSTADVFDTLPAISALSITNRRFAAAAQRKSVKRGTAFRYVLSEAAQVKFTIRRRTIGRRVGRKCRVTTRANRGRKKCVLYKRAGALSTAGKQGRNRTKFSGKLRGRKLEPGRYRATSVATDPPGGKSKPRSVSFRIVRP